MSRPKNKKKGRTLPMASLNGDNASHVPADVVWDEENPMTIYMCSQDIEHDPRCNGLCPSYTPTKSQVDLINEARAWARAGMSFFGIPTAYKDTVPIAGINVELFDLECKFQAVRSMLVEKLDMDEDEFEEMFRETKLEAMRGIREQNEAAVRRERMRSLIPAKPPILGPDGGPIIQ